MKKVLALILIAAMVFSTFPAFASNPGYSVDKASVGTADNPLIVSGGLDGFKYVSLGDSVAFGFGLDETLNRGFNYVEGSYPDLISKYLRCSGKGFFQGAVSSTRAIDDCIMLWPEAYKPDKYHINRYMSFFYKIGEEEYGYKQGINDYDAFVRELKKAVKDADFITISNGGNDTLSSLLIYLEQGSFLNENNLTEMYGKSTIASYNAVKKNIMAKVRLAGDISKNKEIEKTVNKVFEFLDMTLYCLGSFSLGQADLLDIIHEMNPEAEIAITGLPGVLYNYDIKIDENTTIDLDKVFTPMVKILNSIIKSEAEERSSYVRYVDIFDVKPLPGTGEFADGIVEINELEDFFKNALLMTHPSYLGHKQIADRILKNFQFRIFGAKITNIKNIISNIKPAIESKTGILKIENLISSLKGSDFIGMLTNILKMKDIFSKAAEFFAS